MWDHTKFIFLLKTNISPEGEEYHLKAEFTVWTWTYCHVRFSV